VLFERIWPQYLRPMPARTLLAFEPRARGLRKPQPIDGGTTINGEVDGIECPFVTSGPVRLQPLRLVATDLLQPHPADLQLRLRFQMDGGAAFDAARPRRVRLHLLGDPATRFTLYLWLVHRARGLSIRDPTGRTVGQGRIEGLGFGADEALLPILPTPLPSAYLLDEYFAFVDKFLGVQIDGLSQVPRGLLDQQFDLVFHLGPASDESLSFDVDNFRLACAAAVNLSQPVDVDLPVPPDTAEFRLQPPRGQLFAVSGVQGRDTKKRQWVDYPSLFEIGHSPLTDPRPRFALMHRLSITDGRGRPLPPSADTLRVTLTHTDGDLPLRLGVGQVNQPSPSAPGFAKYENILPISPPDALRVGHDRHWRILALLAIQPRDLCSARGLSLLLELARGPKSARPLPEIRSVEARDSGKLLRQTLVPLRRVTITVDDSPFEHEGELFLFGNVLSRLFARPPESTTFSEVTLVGQHRGVRYTFPPIDANSD
jgi:type VI secretion system protein ImpG